VLGLEGYSQKRLIQDAPVCLCTVFCDPGSNRWITGEPLKFADSFHGIIMDSLHFFVSEGKSGHSPGNEITGEEGRLLGFYNARPGERKVARTRDLGRFRGPGLRGFLAASRSFALQTSLIASILIIHQFGAFG